jgi:hypothetical protein
MARGHDKLSSHILRPLINPPSSFNDCMKAHRSRSISIPNYHGSAIAPRILSLELAARKSHEDDVFAPSVAIRRRIYLEAGLPINRTISLNYLPPVDESGYEIDYPELDLDVGVLFLSVEEHEVIRRVVLALYWFGIYRP